ncbi:MAG: hypothetical protein K6G83_06105 [Lachnospiraceae bacterium]|nr:hypothetical protein [Lachnospiraceae bacterium]
MNKIKIRIELKKYMARINTAADVVEKALKADYFSDEPASSLLEELSLRLKNIQLRGKQLNDNLSNKSNISAALFDIMEREFEECRHIYKELKNITEPYRTLVNRLAEIFQEDEDQNQHYPDSQHQALLSVDRIP